MLLVIFGAGASHDSADQYVLGELPPPLAKDLVADRFSDIAAAFPSSQPVIARLRSRMSDGTASLEKELAELAERSKDQPERREQLMIFRYYLQRVIARSVGEWMTKHNNFTRYLDLVNELYDRQQAGQTGPIRFATFNYDLMLEEALHTMFPDWNVATLGSYLSGEDFRVFKLHGSINWVRVLPVQINHAEATTGVAARIARDGVDVGSGMLALGDYPEMVGAPTGHYELQVPALAVPMANKTEFECPGEHVDSLSGDIDAVTHVLIIGWRGAERHAVELLARLRPQYKLGLVSGTEDDASELMRNLGSAVEGRADLRITELGGFVAFMAHVDTHLRALFA